MRRLSDILSPADLKLLQSHGRRQHYGPGTEIFAQGTEGEALFVIETGVVEVSTLTEGGRRLVLSHLGAGDLIGEFSVLDQGPRSASAAALGDVTGALVGAASFRSFLTENPQIHFSITELLCERLRQANGALQDRTAREGSQRLARSLMRIAEVAGKTDAEGSLEITVPMSQTAIGDIVGLTRANVNRLLRAWRDEGLLAIERGHIRILSPARLAEIALPGTGEGD